MVCTECAAAAKHRLWYCTYSDTVAAAAMKCNVDASFYEDLGHAGGGWCVRNAQGRFVFESDSKILKNIK
jgi:hypothetical protein